MTHLSWDVKYPIVLLTIMQVVTKTGGNGCLNVTVTGPRARTVRETAVVYTGDDIYEVLFEVTQPGYYIINVKWSDYNIPESPFICKVTY